MQRVLRFEEAYKAESIIDNMALQKGVLKDYLEKRRTAAFESYINFNLCSFDFYDVDSTLVDTARVLLYLDREDLIIFCEDERTCQSMKKLLPEQESDKEMALRGFFTALLENDMDFIDSWENSITEAEDQALAGDTKDYLGKIIEYRKELLRLKRYYTQLQVIFDGLLDNDGGMVWHEFQKYARACQQIWISGIYRGQYIGQYLPDTVFQKEEMAVRRYRFTAILFRIRFSLSHSYFTSFLLSLPAA